MASRYIRKGPARQKRRENGSGQRVLLRAMVDPAVAASAKALARARHVSLGSILAEALTRRMDGWGPFL